MFPDPPPNRAEFPVLWPITLRWSDNDVYGHVNNVIYYSWFDTAVNGWLMRATGADVRQLDALGVVVETACRYRSEVSFPGTVEIGVRVARVGTSSVTYQLAAFADGAEQPAALGHFVHVYVDHESRRPTAVPEVVRHALETAKADR